MLALTRVSALSTLAEEFDMLLELVLRAPNSWSTLEDELESDSELVRLVAMLALTEFSDASMLDEDTDRLSELVLIVLRALSTLLDDTERLREEA